MGILISTKGNTEEEDIAGFRKPSHYRGREGPKFTVLDFTRDYEYRRYEPAMWISAHISELPYSKAVNKGSSILSRYFDGKNGPEKGMAETCPLTTRVESGKSLAGIGDFTVSLHIPYEFQSSPPAPMENKMCIQEFAEQLAYVATFAGTAREGDWQEEVLKLAAVLDKEGLQYDKDAYYTSRYEKTFYLGKKRNEVMLIAQPGKTRF